MSALRGTCFARPLRWRAVLVGALMTMVSAGCGDPWSQRRIGIRSDRFNSLAEGIAQREARGSEQLKETAQYLEERWQRDRDRLRLRIQRAGDIIW